jgi:diguanylate cyclase (GGDEF)-like protein
MEDVNKTRTQLIQEVRRLRRRVIELEAAEAGSRRAELTLLSWASRLRETQTQLEKLATTDELTQLGNRRAFDQRLCDEIRHAQRLGQPLSLLLLDVDRFKEYNDTFGHPTGDKVLQLIAEILYYNTRSTDFVARYGGEEFAIIMPNTDRQDCLSLGEQIRKTIKATQCPGRGVTVSGGASTWPGRSDDTGTALSLGARMVDKADKALYHAKESGRNRIVHASTLAQRSKLIPLLRS